MVKTIRARLFGTQILFLLLILISWFLNFSLVKDHEQDEQVIDLIIRKITLVNQITFESISSQSAISVPETTTFEEILLLLENGGEFVANDGMVVVYSPINSVEEQVAQLRSDWDAYLRALSTLRITEVGSPRYEAIETELMDRTNQIDTRIFVLLSALEQYTHQKHDRLQSVNFVLILIAVSTLAISLYNIHIRITEPIQRLTQSVQNFSKGIFVEPMEIHGDDEIDRLSGAFQVMRSEITSHRTNLEDRIALRVREITTAFEISQDIVVQQDLNVLLGAARERVQALMKANKVSVCLLDHKSMHSAEKEYLNKTSVDWLKVVEAPRMLANDVLIDNVSQCNCDLIGVVSGRVFVTPLRVGKELIGEICVVREQQADLGENEKRAFLLVANAIAIAIQNARLTEQLQLNAYESAKLNERKRVASDLHDNLAQTLNVLHMQTEALGEELPSDTTERIPQQILDIRANLATALEQVRLAISGSDRLYRSKTDLANELRGYLDGYETETGMVVNFEDPQKVFDRFNELVQKQIVYIVREALTNVRKHTKANRIEIAIKMAEHEGILSIQDDGDGFDPSLPSGDHHLGLRIMKARAERTQGHLDIQSIPGHGTLVIATFPMPAKISDPS